MNIEFLGYKRISWIGAFVFAIVGAVLPSATMASTITCTNDSNPNLVKNGDFEKGSGGNIQSWTVEWPSSVDPYVYIDTTNPNSGEQDLAMGSSPAPNDIVQKIKGTTVGSVYTVCLRLASSPNLTGGVTTFEVLWNNVPVLELTNSAQFSYQYYAFNTTASGNDLLRIRERNKQGFYYLDDVSVQLCSGCTLAADANNKNEVKTFLPSIK